jgi:hypothetical protein
MTHQSSHTLGLFTANPTITEKPTESVGLVIDDAPLGPPPHGPLLGWHLENGHLKKVHSLNSHGLFLSAHSQGATRARGHAVGGPRGRHQ